LKLGLTAMAEIDVAGNAANAGAPRRGGRGGDMRSLDKNGDGKVTEDEAPAALKGIFDRIDRNKDGAIDDKEVEAIRNQFPQLQPRD
jgi:Ca2+-binding EF-hand superfamily protein